MFGETIPSELHRRYLRITIARETGWTLAYVDSLGMQDWLDYLAVMGGMADVRHFHTTSD